MLTLLRVLSDTAPVGSIGSPQREAVKELRIDYFRREACAGAPAPPSWNGRSETVCTGGFGDATDQGWLISIFFTASVLAGDHHAQAGCLPFRIQQAASASIVELPLCATPLPARCFSPGTPERGIVKSSSAIVPHSTSYPTLSHRAEDSSSREPTVQSAIAARWCRAHRCAGGPRPVRSATDR